MTNKKNSSGRQTVIVFVSIIAVVVLILAGVSLYQIFRPNPYGKATVIDGLSETGMSRDAAERISANLYTTIEAWPDDDGMEVPTSGAKVREGSVEKKHDEATGIKSADFIVDIESLQRSYRIHVEWGNDANITGYPYVISCLRSDDEVIYPDFYCVDDFEDVTDSSVINSYLPYWGKTESGYEYMVRSKKYSDGREYFEVSVDSCGDRKIINEALEATKKWINTLGINSEAFLYEAPDYLCGDGEF